MKVKSTLLSVVFLGLTCTLPTFAQGNSGGGNKGGGETTGYGNNLSYPVVFAEGVGMTGLPIPSTTVWSPPDSGILPVAGDETGLRPFAGEVFGNFPWLPSPYAANPDYYAQNTENTWRAEWVAGTPGTPEEVQVDWGDNLISQSWTASQPVRVETVLRQPISMVGYPMTSLLGSRRSEIVGTTGDAEASLGRTVYSRTAHLVIEKYNDDWTAVVQNGCSVDKTVHSDQVDGPGNYAAEVNVTGSLIYGYNWMLSTCSASPDTTKAGNWKITFSLDDLAGSIARNAKIVGVADINSPITTVSVGDYFSSLQIKILSTRPTGGKGRVK